MPGLSGDVWPIHPHRFPDELLSFWVLRVAHDNRIKLQTFTNITFGRTATLWNRDIDRSATQSVLETLSVRTGAPVEELKAGMLSSFEGGMFERHNPFGNSHWVLPLGIYHRTRRAYGMQFCPMCLFWDPVPYFRRHWRLGLSTICDRHGTMLHDRCPQCSAPVIYFRNDLGHRKNGQLGGHTLCWQCKFDLRRAPTWGGDWLDAQTYIALRSLLTFIDCKFAVAGQHCFDYANLFFVGLHRICEMLASKGKRRKYDKFQAAVSAATGMRLPHPAGRASFELLSLAERHRILLCALWLVMDWPDRFVCVCKDVGLCHSYVLGDLVELPYWLDRALKRDLSEHVAKRNTF